MTFPATSSSSSFSPTTSFLNSCFPTPAILPQVYTFFIFYIFIVLSQFPHPNNLPVSIHILILLSFYKFIMSPQQKPSFLSRSWLQLSSWGSSLRFLIELPGLGYSSSSETMVSPLTPLRFCCERLAGNLNPTLCLYMLQSGLDWECSHTKCLA